MRELGGGPREERSSSLLSGPICCTVHNQKKNIANLIETEDLSPNRYNFLVGRRITCLDVQGEIRPVHSQEVHQLGLLGPRPDDQQIGAATQGPTYPDDKRRIVLHVGRASIRFAITTLGRQMRAYGHRADAR
jgi:hypothetical protein